MYKKDTFKNGLTIITAGMPHMESVSIGVWIGVGGRYEDKKLCGMSHIIEHMLFKGTEKRSANDLKEAIEGIGGSFNGFTGEEVTCYLVKLPSKYTDLGLDVLSDMVLCPKVDTAELEKEKHVVCEEIKMYMDQPAHRVFDILAEIMWPNHALGRPIAGYAESVKNFTREGLMRFKNRFYQPFNITVVAAGKIRRNNIIKKAKSLFRAPSRRSRLSYSSLGKAHKGKRVAISHKDTKQTHIAIGFHGPRRGHKMRYAVSLLNVILGGNMSSRLFDKLREQMALCYDISSSVKSYKETGAFLVHAGVDNNKFFAATEAIMRELALIKSRKVNPDELRRAKDYVAGQFLMALEDTASRMIWLGEKITTEGKAPAVNDVIKNVGKVTAEDIKNVATATFKRENLSLAIVGPVEKRKKEKLERLLAI